MATTISNLQTYPLGAGLVITTGTYSTDGSTVLTLKLSGGNIVAVQFSDASGNAIDALSSPAVTLSALSTTGSVTSITVTPSSGAISGGGFFAIHGGT